MFDVALSVSAFVRSKTHADVAWMVSPHASTDTLALTPGGGRIGSVAQGVFDSALADIANLKLTQGRLVSFTVGAFEASISGYNEGASVEFLLVPVELFPAHTWPALLEREPIAIVCTIDNGDVVLIETFTPETMNAANERTQEIFNQGISSVSTHDNQVITVLVPTTKLVIAGNGPIADALQSMATTMGWNVRMETRNDVVAGYVADMSPMDGVVIMGHNVEQSGRSLELALESDAGYIGALGSLKMQEARADWLAYRDVTDLSRVHGPAGLNIQASSPGEVAVSILAEMIAVLKGL
jgi:xanthine dehydrogenase accessory factor